MRAATCLDLGGRNTGSRKEEVEEAPGSGLACASWLES